MKKYLLLFLIVFLTTGCDVEYNLKIDKTSYNEDINITVPNTESWPTVVENTSKIDQISYASDSDTEKHYYDFKLKENTNNYQLNYKYKFQKSNITQSSAINKCYKIFNYEETDNDITFFTNKTFQCLYIDGAQVIDKATINIITPLKVLENNADKVEGNTYTWEIDETNFEDKPIDIKIKKEQTASEKINQTLYNVDKKISSIGLIIICTSLIIIGGLAYLFIKRKHKKKNEF